MHLVKIDLFQIEIIIYKFLSILNIKVHNKLLFVNSRDLNKSRPKLLEDDLEY